jgi:hypothetical protein
MYRLTVEESLSQIAENLSIIRAALHDPNLEEFAVAGCQRLLSDGLGAIAQLRQALPLMLLVDDLPPDDAV